MQSSWDLVCQRCGRGPLDRGWRDQSCGLTLQEGHCCWGVFHGLSVLGGCSLQEGFLALVLSVGRSCVSWQGLGSCPFPWEVGVGGVDVRRLSRGLSGGWSPRSRRGQGWWYSRGLRPGLVDSRLLPTSSLWEPVSSFPFSVRTPARWSQSPSSRPHFTWISKGTCFSPKLWLSRPESTAATMCWARQDTG